MNVTPVIQKIRKSAWAQFAAVILLFLGSRWWLNEVSGSGFGRLHGKLWEYLQSFYYIQITRQCAVFATLALFSFILFGILWYSAKGIKRRVYYALFAFFAFQYGAGPGFYLMAFYPFRAPVAAPKYFVVFYGLWLAFLLAVIIYEFLSRKRS